MNVLAESNATRGARRRARTRSAILDAAERSFAEVGYRRTKMEDVAERADVAIGSIYGHFGNKDGLYFAVVERAVELFASYLREAYRPEWTPLEQVVACGDAYLRFHLEHPGAFRFLAFDGVETDAPDVDPAQRARVGEGVEALIVEFEQKIQEAIDAGEVRALDARLAGRFLWGAWNGVVALGLRGDGLALDETEIHDALQQARDIVLAGLCAPAARDAEGAPLAQLRTVASPEDGDSWLDMGSRARRRQPARCLSTPRSASFRSAEAAIHRAAPQTRPRTLPSISKATLQADTGRPARRSLAAPRPPTATAVTTHGLKPRPTASGPSELEHGATALTQLPTVSMF